MKDMINQAYFDIFEINNIMIVRNESTIEKLPFISYAIGFLVKQILAKSKRKFIG